MKNKFIKASIILTIGGLFTKLLGMLIKISLTRNIGSSGISLYMLIIPTFDLFISFCNLGVPIAINKLISEKKITSKKIIIPTSLIILLYNLLLIIILLIIAPYLSNNLLHNKNTYYPIIIAGLSLPFIAISSIIKGYFYGKLKVTPIVISNIIEQITRLFFISVIIKRVIKYGIVFSVSMTLFSNIFSELSSIIVLILFLPKNKIKIDDFCPDYNLLKRIFNISIPTTMGRLIGSITYFLEPIILTNILIKCGYSNSYITYEYGVLNGYSYPLLLMPSFFSSMISLTILPLISNSYSNNNIKYTKKIVKEGLILTSLIGSIFTLLFIFIPDILLNIIYKTTSGYKYVKVLAPVFMLLYLESILTSTLNGMGKTKIAMLGTLYGSVVKIISLIIFSYFNIGIYSLIIASSLNIITVTINHSYYTYKYLKEKRG